MIFASLFSYFRTKSCHPEFLSFLLSFVMSVLESGVVNGNFHYLFLWHLEFFSFGNSCLSWFFSPFRKFSRSQKKKYCWGVFSHVWINFCSKNEKKKNCWLSYNFRFSGHEIPQRSYWLKGFPPKIKHQSDSNQNYIFSQNILNT